MADSLTLTVNGRIFEGWESVEIARGVETVAGGFSLTVTDRWARQAEPWPIRLGDACRLAINGTVIIDGYVDQVIPSLAGDSRSLTVKGRDRTGDLVDCSAAHDPAEWANIDLLRLAGTLCQPFGIKVAREVALGQPFTKFAVQPGESTWEALERACRLRAVLATSDGAGGVLLTRTGQAWATDELVQGQNLLAANATLDMSRRFSEYAVQAQAAGTDFAFGETAAEVEGIATDVGVPRYRPLTVIAEGAADARAASERAQWEAIVRAARGAVANVTVQGWTQRGGGLWQPNQRVRIRSPWLRLEGEMLITAVTYRKSNASGTTTELRLVRPDALTPQPEVPKSVSGAGGTVNPWQGVFL